MEGKTILIIEDNKIFKEMLVRKLEENGFSTVTIEGKVLPEEIKKAKPNLLLIDIVSSKGRGAELVKKLRQNAETSDVPIIAIAKMEGSVIVDHARELGVRDAIDKVIFDPNDLLKKVKKALKVPTTKIQEVARGRSSVSTDRAPKQKPSGKKGKILLIEGDSFMREFFARALRDVGFEVDEAPDAETGFDILYKKIPEVILLDLLLPGKSGFEFLEEVKQKKPYRHIPVIVVSNLGSKGDIDRATDLGASDFLVKANSTIDEIISKSKKFVKKGRKAVTIPESLK